MAAPWISLVGVGLIALPAGWLWLTSRKYLFWRQSVVFTVALMTFADYKLTETYIKWRFGVKDDEEATENENPLNEATDAAWEGVHERSAARICSATVVLEGMWVKVGQYLSTRADIMPDPYLNHLRLLQDSLPPRKMDEVCAIIEADLGEKPEQYFASFEEKPLGTASIAQVHRAVTRDGRDVVVKVQHSNIKEIVHSDFHNLCIILEWLVWSNPTLDFRTLLVEWAKESLKELDFTIEAANLERVRFNLLRKGRGPHGDLSGGEAQAGRYLGSDQTIVDVEVPGVVKATRRVLVMDYIDGVRLNDLVALDAMSVDRHQLVEAITKAYAHQIFLDGFFNADPHPGNFLVCRSPPHQPALLDFGLTKELPREMQRALAKMLLATAEGDVAMLLSSLSEMGLKLSYDMPEKAMAAAAFIFRRSAPLQEARRESTRLYSSFASSSKLKAQEKSAKQDRSLRRSPVDAFPGELIFFTRVLNLLRGLSVLLNTQMDYFQIMKPYAEALLLCDHLRVDCHLSESAEGTGAQWVTGTCADADLDARLRELLVDLIKAGEVVGMQVCAYKDGEMCVDLAAGFLGVYDPRPVRSDSLFPCFSVTKGVTAAMLHWLADRGMVEFDAPVSKYWPEFGCAGKEECTLAHLLTHTAGLSHALSSEFLQEPMMMCRWHDVLAGLAKASPSSPPGSHEMYHTLSFGWLVGGVVEAAAGTPFQQILNDAFTQPLGLQGEFFIGIPAGVESRLATLSLDKEEWERGMKAQIASATGREGGREREQAWEGGEVVGVGVDMLNSLAPAPSAASSTEGNEPEGSQASAPRPSSSSPSILVPPSLPTSSPANIALIFNSLFVRRAIVPAGNGHFSARALARFYAALADGGVVPPLPSSQLSLGDTSAEVTSKEASSSGTGRAEAKSIAADGGATRRQVVAEGAEGDSSWSAGNRGSIRASVNGVVKEGGDGGASGGGDGGASGAVGEENASTPGGSNYGGGGVEVMKKGFAAWLSGGKKNGSNGSVRAQLGTADAGVTESLLSSSEAEEVQEEELPSDRTANDGHVGSQLFKSADVIDAFIGTGRYSHLTRPDSRFGLGFIRFSAAPKPTPSQSPTQTSSATIHSSVPESAITHSISSLPFTRSHAQIQPIFGHPGMGGSTAFADASARLSIAITINKLHPKPKAISRVVQLLCKHFGATVPPIYQPQSE